MGGKKNPKGKRKLIRHEAPEPGSDGGSPKTAEKAPDKERPRMPDRLKEKDSGFGVLKGVGLVIIALILVSTVLFNRAGGRDALRGDKLPGEPCEKTAECQKGSMCYAYQGDRHRCMTRCSKQNPCEPGYTCVTAASQKRRKGLRVADVCVEDAKI